MRNTETRRIRGTERVVLILVLLAIMSVIHPAAAQDEAPVPALLVETDKGIIFYGLDEQNILKRIGQLPQMFSLLPQRITSLNEPQKYQLFNWWNFNVVLSPNGSHIAITAEKEVTGRNSLAYMDFYLFLYHIETQELEQAYTIRWEIGPRADLRWSPNSEYILIEPVYGDSGGGDDASPFIYNLKTGKVVTLTKYWFHMTWAADSTYLLHVDDEDIPSFHLINPDNGSQQLLVGQSSDDFEVQKTEWVYPLCDFTWSLEQQRWYFVASCVTESERVYSIDLSGHVRLEADIPNYAAQQVGQIDKQAILFMPTGYGLDLNISDATLYASLYFTYDISKSAGYETIKEWRVIKIKSPGDLETVFSYRLENPDWNLTDVQSRNNDLLAFVMDNQIVVVDLKNESVRSKFERNEHDFTYDFQWRYWTGRWIDNNRYLYQDMNDVWLFDARDNRFTNLTADIEPTAWLIPQTNSN